MKVYPRHPAIENGVPSAVQHDRTNVSRTGFSIRPATPEDINAVRSLMIHTFEEDFGYGYTPEYHADVDALQEEYLDNDRHTLAVAVDDVTGAIIGTGGIRSGGLKPDFNQRWLVDRYNPARTAQLVRIYTAAEHRGRGVARALVGAVLRFVAEDGGYDVVALHADPRSPGAERFWRSMPTTLILDDRDGPSGSLHFEIAIPNIEYE
jgi:GNAT superfamily N-acetyltransferase